MRLIISGIIGFSRRGFLPALLLNLLFLLGRKPPSLAVSRQVPGPDTVSCALQAINTALWALGVVTPRDDEELRSTMAYGMFDTRGRCSSFRTSSLVNLVFQDQKLRSTMACGMLTTCGRGGRFRSLSSFTSHPTYNLHVVCRLGMGQRSPQLAK